MLRAPTNVRKFLIMLYIFFLYLGIIDIGVGLFFAVGACCKPHPLEASSTTPPDVTMKTLSHLPLPHPHVAPPPHW